MKKFGSALITAIILACAAVLILSSAVLAADRHDAKTASPAAAQNAQPASQHAASSQTSTDRDVPGASVDPSKSDHDNGIGNNCDPGWGKGNQAKFPSGETTTCRSAAEVGAVSGAAAAAAGLAPGSGLAPASGSGGATGATGPAGAVAAATASSAPHGAVLAATGLPLGAGLLGGLLALGGALLTRIRR